MFRKTLGAAALSLPLLAFAAGPALAATASLSANLTPVNAQGASASAMVSVSGDQVTVKINSTGLTPNQPHAQHFHIGGQNMCPPPSADTDGDGKVSVSEGAPFYGKIQVSLTTTGDSSADSALAVDRFPKADAQGNLSYSRTLTVPADIASQIADGKAALVQHGVDYDKSGAYDGDAKSDIDPSLPKEATDPAVCGTVTAAPAGGADTGGGGTSGNDQEMLLLLGGGLLATAAGTGTYAVRRARS